jgi:class 3 adenylate cyclase
MTRLAGRKLPRMVKLAASLRGDPEATSRIARKLAGRRADDRSIALVAEAARALEPVLSRALENKPSRLTELGLKGTTVLGALTGAESPGPLSFVARSKSIGIVFVDIVDFTTFTTSHGDDEAIMLLARTGELVDQAVEVGKGVCVKRLGDGFLLAFPSPSQAVRAAIALNRLAARSRIDLRIAVHAGQPTVESDDLLGYDVNLAARLLQHCKPGEIVVTDEAKTKAERRLTSVSFDGRRTIRVRGIDTPVIVHSPGPRGSRVRTK